MGKLSLLYPRIYTVALLPFLSLMTTGAIFMAIGALVLSGDIETAYIGASHVYFHKVESIRDASIQIISPYRVEEADISHDSRSEARRVGKEGGMRRRCRRVPYN